MEAIKKCLDEYNRSRGTGLVLGELIGSGGMADVYDLPGTIPPWVVKVMNTVDSRHSNGMPVLSRTRKKYYAFFEKEIQAMVELREDPYTMPLLDWAVFSDTDEEGLPELQRTWEAQFLVFMPKLITLPDYIKTTAVSEAMLTALAKDVCKSLICLESKRILHRDVKPLNLYVDTRQEPHRFILGDFGACRRSQENIFSTGPTSVYTEGFMAPELSNGTFEQGNYNSDIYSLGATLYYLATGGAFLYQGDSEGCMEPSVPAELSPGFGEILRKACRFHFKERYLHAEDMLKELEALEQQAQPQEESPISEPQQEEILLAEELFALAKEALRKNAVEKAIEYAALGKEQGDTGCRRLWVYCTYNLTRKQRKSLQAGASGENREKLLELRRSTQLLQELATELDNLIFEENDSVAWCLRALICMENGDKTSFHQYIHRSADAGCAMGQYYCGRALCEGWVAPRERKSGCRYILLAAEQGFLPAVVFLKDKLYPLDPEFDISFGLEETCLGPGFSPEEIRESIIASL